MVHRELLAVLLVCCLGLSLVGAQPALAGDGSGTTLLGADSDGLIEGTLTDGLIQEESDDGSDTREGTETGTADGETDEDGTDSDDGDGESDDAGDDSPDDHDDNESNDEDGWGDHSDTESDDDGWGDDSDDDHRWGDQSENENESSDSDEGMWDSERRNENDTEPDDERSSDNDTDADANDGWFERSSDGEENGTDAENETENSTTSANETRDGFLLDDVTDIVVDVGDVTTNVTPDLSTNATNETGPTRGEMSNRTADRDDGELRPSSGLDRILDDGLDGPLESERFDGLSAFVDGDGDRGAVAEIGGLVTTLESESVLVSKLVSVLAATPAETDDRQLSADAGFEGAAETEPDSGERTDAHDSSVPLAASDGGADDERSDEDDTAGADSGDDGGEAPSGGPSEGAALLVLVGYLGGGRLAMNQTAMLASMGQPGLLGTLQQSVASHLGGLSDRIVPPVFGYSRQDSSDPLENETRAQIFELVEDSPGIYYAQLAEETDVTVETVRYHCRILADEGLVERRKLRGRQRLYPVSMEDDDPELAAAMADSAASDVLSAIERREPTTLSAVADAVGCAPSTVSYHLDRLEEDGLVSRERDGGSVRIRLRRATKSALQGSVADD